MQEIYPNIDIEQAKSLIGSYIESNHMHKVLLVRGKQSYIDCGAKMIIDAIAREDNINIVDFFSFANNPKWEDVKRGTEILNECKASIMIAIGGGSVMDMAKLIRHNADLFVQLVAIPTTAGTGAEATQFAVCYKDGIKHAVEGQDMLPEKVFLIPQLTMGNNLYLTACTGFDAFAQAIESYWNIHSSKESNQYAENAIGLLADALTRFSEDAEMCMSDFNWRSQMMHGAHIAGKAINITRTTAPHAMSYTLTSKYAYPHGHAVALTFPYFFEKNIRCVKDEYASENYDEYVKKMHKLVKLLGWSFYDDLYAKMKQFIYQLGLGYDVNKPFDSVVIENGVNFQRAENNPVRLNERIINEAVVSIR